MIRSVPMYLLVDKMLKFHYSDMICMRISYEGTKRPSQFVCACITAGRRWGGTVHSP